MVADKPHKDIAATLYAEWISAGVKLSLAGLETAAKFTEAATRTIVSAKAVEPKSVEPNSVEPKSVVPMSNGDESTSVAPAVRAAKLDDLKLISGIGPKLEAQLKAHGIKSANDVAALSAEAVAKIDAELNLGGRIARDKWVELARDIVGGTHASR